MRQESMSGQDQFHVLHQHFMEVGPAAKALLLSTYAKLANLYPDCRELVTPVRFVGLACMVLLLRAYYVRVPRMLTLMEPTCKKHFQVLFYLSKSLSFSTHFFCFVCWK